MSCSEEARPQGLFAEIAGLQQAGRRAVLATPLWSVGSVPLRHQSRLLLRDDGSTRGTIGGGPLEAQVLAAAREVLVRDRLQVMEFDLAAGDAADAGMVCGGRCAVMVEPIVPDRAADVYAAAAQAERASEPIALVTVLGDEGRHSKVALTAHGELIGEIAGGIAEAVGGAAADALGDGRPRFIEEPLRVHIDPVLPRSRLLIFGAGHIAEPLALMGDLVGFRVWIIDDRDEFANRRRFPWADEVVVSEVPAAFGTLSVDEDSYVVSVTRGHVMDEEVVAHALRTPARYVGMIGSKRKVATVKERLRQRGFAEADIARLHAPIGLDIGAQTVEEIAVSIVAQLIRARRLSA